MKFLTAIPVYNEEKHLEEVLRATSSWSSEILVVDDGSDDGTGDILRRMDGIQVIRHETNLGYGAGLNAAFRYAVERGYDVLVTMDCDGQHEPKRIHTLLDGLEGVDIASGSRYLEVFDGDSKPPEERRAINKIITDEINRELGLQLTDAFCGFKAYRRETLERLRITEAGYGMPLQVWVQAVRLKLRIREVPVPLIYLDEKRAFGGALNDADERLSYYRRIIHEALVDSRQNDQQLSAPAPPGAD